MAVNLPKIVEKPYFSRYCKSTKENRNVTMTFPVNLSLGCFRTAALLMVTLNMESRKPMERVYPENRFKNAKAHSSFFCFLYVLECNSREDLGDEVEKVKHRHARRARLIFFCEVDAPG